MIIVATRSQQDESLPASVAFEDNGVQFCDKNVGRNNAGLEKTGFKDTPISRPIPNETPTQNMFLKSSHRALSNGAIHITIQGDPDPNMYRSKSILISNPALIKCTESDPV